MAQREKKKTQTGNGRKTGNRLVCDGEDLLPFAWRTPPVLQDRRASKVWRELQQEEQLRREPNEHGRGNAKR